MIDVLIADDQRLFAESLRVVLELDNSDFRVVGTAGDGREAIRMVREHRPRIVLMDVRMPGLDGVEATKILRIEFPSVQIIMLTVFDDDDYVREALRFGAHGYLLKSIPPRELSDSIRAVSNGDLRIAQRLVHKLGDPLTQAADTVKNPLLLDKLSRRELEIIQFIADGLGNRQISILLKITDQSVRNDVSRIYAKLDVHNRYDAVQRASRAGLLLTAAKPA